MILTNIVLIRIAVFVLGVCGFAIAKHIHNHKKPESAPLVCPMNFDCHGVVHSEYSTFMGIHLEILGMIYYGIEALFYLYLIFMPANMPLMFATAAILFALVAFLFSLYLIAVQIFILKKGCFWCFVSAGVSILIFVATVYLYGFSNVLLKVMQ